MRVSDFIKLQQYSLNRSPRWRYDRIRQLLDARPRRGPARADDAITRRAATFIARWDAVPSRGQRSQKVQEARQELFPQYPDLYLAYELFTANNGERLRGALEARILAGQPDEEIAKRLGTMPEAVHAYEQLFFHVRDRLTHSDYIVTKVLAASIQGGLETPSLDLSAKFFGYFAGPVVLDFVLSGYDRNISPPTDSATCDEYMDSFFRSNVSRRSAEATAFFEVNRFNVMELFQIHTNLLALTAKAKDGQDNLGMVEESIDLLLKAIPWSTGKDRRMSLQASPLARYSNSAGELRSAELLSAAAGEHHQLPDLSNIVMPEARETGDD